ncbi:hypothetical protein B0J12DRAFT_696791 [Macrophomina phaseolina]|uniref:Uncharacterized protein n=1 Tax=Macrophomina phaseolina TaxID=35725 RepID=A0ABQ8GI13_9PEZI|nr:hypothetical protein B0J12DRAFT_696791 [Macrophomina phaseolina]
MEAGQRGAACASLPIFLQPSPSLSLALDSKSSVNRPPLPPPPPSSSSAPVCPQQVEPLLTRICPDSHRQLRRSAESQQPAQQQHAAQCRPSQSPTTFASLAPPARHAPLRSPARLSSEAIVSGGQLAPKGKAIFCFFPRDDVNRQGTNLVLPGSLVFGS